MIKKTPMRCLPVCNSLFSLSGFRSCTLILFRSSTFSRQSICYMK